MEFLLLWIDDLEYAERRYLVRTDSRADLDHVVRRLTGLDARPTQRWHSSMFGVLVELTEASAQDMLSVMVVAHPNHPASSRRWIGEAAGNPKIVGVKLHPVLGGYDILSASMHRLMEEVIAPSGLPVLSHVGNESPNVPIDRYLQLAKAFPSVRFIAAHLGVGLLGLADAAIDAWTKMPLENVWFDMGTLRVFCAEALEGLLAAVGPDRICFGTDAPLYLPAPFACVLERANVSDEVREKIAWRNVLQVIPALAGRAGVPA